MDYVVIVAGALACVGLLLAAGGALSGERRERAGQQARLARVERKLDGLLDHLGIAYEQPELGRVEQLLGEGKTVAAVKAYRDATGAGLKEAKDEVDRLAGR
ncbi:hypothetical protein [Pseudonocardia sp. HH130630-07]|uniref:hypothetical protein n=1 Tax=Pseudonocardia sp. HH130630-07 TaxID=1690815 RepID=UPI000814C51C|nr:hypothetical protein [Pseudonocardia sp. HH130630-07]ANY09746.1 hypothetical protein AFB00_02965 [Pseudonocardia sp. HH130630-07]